MAILKLSHYLGSHVVHLFIKTRIGNSQCFRFLVLFPLSDSMIILWKFNNAADPNADIFMEADEIQNKESWTFHKALR